MRQRSLLRLEELEDRLTPSTLGQPWPDPGHLTLSFVPDGTDAGGTPSGLFSMFNSQASTAAWEMEILRAFQTWALNTNVNIGVVTDGKQPLGTTGAVQSDSRFGDIRIASKALDPSAVSTASPFSWSGTTWSGDMLLNSLYNFGINGQGTYDLYTIALHEAGHVFGIQDNTSNTQSAMYDTYIGPRTGLSSQDIADIQSLYGVRQADQTSNSSFSTATSLGTVLSQQSVQADISSSQDADYFKFNTLLVPLLSSVTVGIQTAGLSLLEPTLSVYDAGHHLVGTATATSPLHGNVSVTINGLAPLSTYYFKVSGAPNSGGFGIGGYQATVTYNVLPVLGYTPLTGVVYSLLNHTLQTALALPRAFGNNTDQRFDYLHKATILTPTQQDYYSIQSPSAPAGTTFVMHALAWELDVNGLHPVIHVFDAQNNPVPVDVLGNMDGLYSIQIAGVSPNSTYKIEVAALNPSGSNATGNYELGVKFSSDAPVALALLAGNSLSSTSSPDTGTLTMSQNGLFHFVLASANGGSSSTVGVAMTIYDDQGNVVVSLTSVAGQPPATAVVYLKAGSYSISYTVSGSSGSFTPLSYWLFGEVLSDPIGAYQTNTTNSPTSGPPSGGGYTYTGGSNSNTTTGTSPQTY